MSTSRYEKNPSKNCCIVRRSFRVSEIKPLINDPDKLIDCEIINMRTIFDAKFG